MPGAVCDAEFCECLWAFLSIAEDSEEFLQSWSLEDLAQSIRKVLNIRVIRNQFRISWVLQGHPVSVSESCQERTGVCRSCRGTQHLAWD
jgi:hypothetical protein